MKEVFIDRIFASFLAVIGGMSVIIYNLTKEFSKTEFSLANKISSLDVKIAEQYVTKTDLNNSLNRIDTKLESINNTLMFIVGGKK